MDIYAANWHENDDAHTEASPNGLPENCAPSGVNNWARATMGALKRYVNQQSPVLTTGSASAFLVSYSVPPGALYNGSTHTIEFHAVNAAGATLNIGGLGASPLHYFSAGAWRVIPTGLIGANQAFRVMYNTAAGAYRILRDRDDTGEVVAFAGATAPAGALLCYGQAISRTDYAALFAALSTAHGVGDGSSTFNLPDLRGRVTAGKGDMGGTESGRLNGQIASVLGAAGGQQSQNYAVAGTFSGSGSISGTAAVNVNTNAISTGPFGAAGGGAANVSDQLHHHNVFQNAPVSGSATVSGSVTGSTDVRGLVQPTMILNYVIRI